MHRTPTINHNRNRVVVYCVDTPFQADLVDMSTCAAENDNHIFLLTCIDEYSKYSRMRVLKKRSGPKITKAFESTLDEGRLLLSLQTDRGHEFFKKRLQDLRKKHNIYNFATASIC